MTMIAALVALGAGAVAGIYLATRHFLRKRMPALVAVLHGLGGATGFALVLLTVVREPTYQPIREVLYLLIATVLLGVVNLLFHVRRVRHRTSLILLHGLTAVTSAAMLIRAIALYTPPAAAGDEPARPRPASPAPSGAEPRAASPAPPAAEPRAAEPDTGVAAPIPPSAPEPPPQRAAAAEFAVPAAVAQALARAIQFETNRAVIRASSLADVAELATLIDAHPEISRIEVQGHADERGDDARNVALTRARAAAVVDALVARGMPRARLRSAGYGARCPVDPACQQDDAPESCHAPEAWQRDRRVVFRVLQIGETEFRGELVCPRGADLIPREHRRFHQSGG